MCFSGHFLEKKYMIFKLNKEVTYFYKDSVVFPSVNITKGKKGLMLKNGDYTNIIVNIEQQCLAYVYIVENI